MRQTGRMLARLAVTAGGLFAAAGCGPGSPVAPTTGRSPPADLKWGAGVGAPYALSPPGSPAEVKVSALLMSQEGLGPSDVRAKYIGKVVELEGITVPAKAGTFPNDKVKFGLAGVPYPSLADRADITCVPAPADVDKVAGLKTGRRVRVTGQVVLIGIGGGGLVNCSVTDLGPGPAELFPVRQAADLTADFVRDEPAARAKYGAGEGGPAVLVVEGEFKGITEDDETATIRMTGADGWSVLGTGQAVCISQYKSYTKGEKVRVSGLFAGYDAAAKEVRLRTAAANHAR